MRTSSEISEAFFSASTGNVLALNNMLGTSYKTFDEAMEGIEKNQGGLVDGMSQTLGGLVSTIQGKLANAAKNMFKPFTENMQQALTGVIDLIDTIAPKIEIFFKDFANGDGSNFPIITGLINSFNILKEAVTPAIDILKEQFSKIKESVSNNFGGSGSIIENVATVIANVIKGLTPVLELLSPVFELIATTAQAVWPLIESVISVSAEVIKGVVEALKPVFGAVTEVIKVVGDTVGKVWPSIQDVILKVWGNLQPVLKLFSTLAEAVANIFITLWPSISTVVKGVWDIVGGIFDKISNALGWIADKAEKVVGWFTKWGDSAKKASDNTNLASGSSSSSNNSPKRAFGVNRVTGNDVPYRLHSGERVLTRNEADRYDSKQGYNINIKIDGVTVREEADIEKVAASLARKINEQKVIYGGTF